MAGNGYATTSRKKILEYLMANSDRTVTVTDIDQYLKKHDNEVNITTIYRYLDKLAKEGTVMKYVAEKGSQAVYQRGDGASLRGASPFEMCFLRMHHSFGMCVYG
mgnify:CR=1 FL=1